MNTQEKLFDLIRKQNEFTGEIELQSDLASIGYDSLKFIGLVLKIELAFGIEFSDGDLNYRKFNNLQEIVDYIESKTESMQNK